MKNVIGICLTSLLSSLALEAQTNLVPNPGFESILQVPCNYMGPGDMERFIPDWHQGAASTADIFSTNATAGCAMNPGLQLPHSGTNMAHMISGTGTTWVEYVSTNLTQPLVKGKKYYCEAYVLLLSRSGSGTNNLGFFFGTGSCQPLPTCYRSEAPQVKCTDFILDKTNWTKISGYFVADKEYTTVTFGNFINPETKFSPVAGDKGSGGYDCRYYVDDFVVRGEGTLAATGDSVVNVGATATLIATGGKEYQWVDVRSPKVVIGTGAELKIPVTRRTTFRVSSNGDYVDVTVDVRKKTITYVDELEGRKVRKGRTVIIHHEEITISVHDKNEVDGDSISLYYGDSLIVQHVALTKKKQSFTLKIDKENPTQLILYAENLGSVPPNTAALTIKDGKESTDIVLGSDFKYCDSVMLQYKADD